MLRVNDSKNRPFAEEPESSPVEVLRSLSGILMGKGDELYILYFTEWHIGQFSLTLEMGKSQRNGGKLAELCYDLKL